MVADATSVAARVSIPHAPGPGLSARPHLQTWRRRLDLPWAAVLAALVAVTALIGTIIWSENRDKSDYALSEAIHRLELVADLAVFELGRIIGDQVPGAEHLARLASVMPPSSLAGGRHLYLADLHGDVIAVEPSNRLPRSLSELIPGSAAPGSRQDLGRVEPQQERAKFIAAVRVFPSGHIALVQPLDAILEAAPPPGRAGLYALIAAMIGIAGFGVAYRASTLRARTSETDRARLRQRLETSLIRGRCGLWDWDIAAGTIVWSDSMFQLLGYEVREGRLSIGEVNALVHPGDGDMYGLSRRLATCDRTSIDHELRLRTAGGSWVWVRARGEVVDDPEDGRRHLVGIAIDITAERGLAERNHTADERLRDAVESISEAFVVYDAEERLVLCNSRFRDLHRLPAELLRPGTPRQDIVARGRPAELEREVSVEGRHGPDARTVEARFPGGRWLHVNERRTRDGGLVSVGTDVTQLKRQHDKLSASERRLTGLVRDLKRSRQAAQTQAQQLADLAESYHEERDRAESASRAKTEFLAKMSHELRTPLNIIIGFADMMRQQFLGPLGNEQYVEYAKHIQASGYSLLEVINDILRMSRIDAGTFRLSRDPIDLAATLERVTTVVSLDAQAKDVALVTDAPKLPPLWADNGALHQILIQVLRNAVKFNRHGGTVQVRARRAGDAINVFVADDGIGIPGEFLSRLGKPFEQVEPEYNRSQRGCGLGLPLARALTELHGGALRIRSQEGVGTVVLIRLPLWQPAANDAGAGAAALEPTFLEAAE